MTLELSSGRQYISRRGVGLSELSFSERERYGFFLFLCSAARNMEVMTGAPVAMRNKGLFLRDAGATAGRNLCRRQLVELP